MLTIISLRNCVNCTELPTEQSRIGDNTTLDFSFTGITEAPYGLLRARMGATSYGSWSDSSIVTLPESFLNYTPKATSFGSMFRYCENLNNLPSSLFGAHPKTQFINLDRMFGDCTGLTSVPSGLFDTIIYGNFARVFVNCTALTSIPSGLFDKCVHADSFGSAFENTGLTSIPSGLFDTTVDIDGFWSCFQNTPITSIPADLFDPSIHTNLDQYGFDNTFQDCSALTGAVPELWNLFPSVDGTDCFTGCENASNWDDIPDTWKGISPPEVDLLAIDTGTSLKQWYIFFNVEMDQTSSPAGDAFTSPGFTFTPLGWFDEYTYLIQSNIDISGPVTLSYTEPVSNPFKDLSGIEADSWENYPVQLF